MDEQVIEKLTLEDAADRLGSLREQLSKVIHGQRAVLDQLCVALLCGGHALLEGSPGTAKTLTVRALAMAMDCRMKRIQFTPDLMPSDIVGTNTYNLHTQTFELRPGPIFTDLLLADEINRAPAKTQAALLEAMSERHATIDGERELLSPVFTVFATQNPIEFEGTYPLPEAQQDRFLLKIPVPYPDVDAERDMLQAVHRGEAPERLEARGIEPVMTVAELQAMQRQLVDVQVEPGVMDYLLTLCRATREHDLLLMGASPRAAIHLLQASKASALLSGRDYVIPDDVVKMFTPVIGHRLVLSAEAEVSGEDAGSVQEQILDQTDVPR
ncbi:AAA family ATPase [Phycisphaerales bacterium AB-hyl4]|uniref:AAA family ATPase n=1 Tax=Natronomicrosphaera hydrolytica TaxID=3242702 RepID=A0ABV4U9W2_9BACT